MCLIIHNNTRQRLTNLISKDSLMNFMSLNPDGFGITGYSDKVLTKKGFGKETFLSCLDEIESNKMDYFIHFRKATVGKVSLDNIHPFDIFGDNAFYLMHNGTIPGYDKDKTLEKSDTKILSEEIGQTLNTIIKSDIDDYIKSQDFIESVNKKLGDGRAVLISKRKPVFFNHHLWIKQSNGLLYSKKIDI